MNEEYLEHEGVSKLDGAPVGSGRYPLGSGENPNQHDKGTFRATVRNMRKEGLSDTEIARRLGMSTGEFRSKVSISKQEELAANTARVLYLKDQKGYGWSEIGRIMGVNESTVRKWYNPVAKERGKVIDNVADVLKDAVGKKKYVDIGVGTENYMNISRAKLMAAVAKLKEEGYEVHYTSTKQLGTGENTSLMVLTPKGTSDKEVYAHKADIRMVTDYTENEGRSFLNIEKPSSISSDRVMIRYAEDGGKEKDGVIEIRRGVEDLNMGNSAYNQVRIAVDDTHFLKGMAIYGEDKDFPKGVDVIFNTNKHSDMPKMEVLKEMKKIKVNGKDTNEIDWENPFGATIKTDEQLKMVQRHYTDKDGKQKLSSLNIVNEQGSWDEWSKTLSSQFLSKQPYDLAKKQLNLTYEQKKQEYDDICALTNPVVKKYFLDRYADQCDSDAVNLKAAALPRQTTGVIIPCNTLKNNEVYAPNYDNGEEVVLVRHPHGGTFEIPRLIVNNNNKQGKSIIGNASDAVGINAKVAERLSGADFDGDTVIVIPTKGQNIKTSPALKGLKDFDPKEMYRGYEGMKVIKSSTKQNEMGRVSNLITDMTLKGAPPDEIARAVRHSMVIIDAEKHKLNYKLSEKDNRIDELKAKYQEHGASTLISRAKREVRIPERKELWKPDPETGEKLYKETGGTHTVWKKDKNGNWVNKGTAPNMDKITEMEYYKDAMKLSSGTRMEEVYGTYANRMKALGNAARKESLFTETPPRSRSAREAYALEVQSLNTKVNEAQKNRPLERQALLLANEVIAMRVRSNPALKEDKDAMKKLRNQTLSAARYRVGANKKERMVHITPKEWEAIQAGAVSPSFLSKILSNTDIDEIRRYATPKQTREVSRSEKSIVKDMNNKGYTLKEIADRLNVSTSTVSTILKGE